MFQVVLTNVKSFLEVCIGDIWVDLMKRSAPPAPAPIPTPQPSFGSFGQASASPFGFTAPSADYNRSPPAQAPKKPPTDLLNRGPVSAPFNSFMSQVPPSPTAPVRAPSNPMPPSEAEPQGNDESDFGDDLPGSLPVPPPAPSDEEIPLPSIPSISSTVNQNIPKPAPAAAPPTEPKRKKH
jgi:hypothetical protein